MDDNNKRGQYRYKNKNRNRSRVGKQERRKLAKRKEQKAKRPKGSIKLKLKQVFLPYLGLSILTILLFGALRWLLDIYLDVLPLKESYWDLIIPCLLPVLVVTIWMWPRYELLILTSDKSSSSSCFFVTMVLALAIPLLISQNYLSKAAYEVIEVNSLNDVRHYPKQKYFKVENVEPVKSESVSYVETQVVVNGRRFESTLHIDYYIATPFTAAENIWLGSSYHTKYDNRADQNIKDSQYSAFISDSRYKYAAADLSNIRYFRKLKSSNDRSAYLYTISKANKQSNLSPLVLIPESEVFVDSLDRDFVWGFGSFFIGMGLCLLLILVADIDNQEKKGTRKHRTIKRQKPVKKRAPVSDVSKSLVALFRSNKKRPATLVLILTCIGTFILTVFMGMDIIAPLSRQINSVGGLTMDALQTGQYWRVVTSLFVHAGIMHLAMSLGMLFSAGYILEKVLGPARFMLAFFICGIVSNVLGIFYYDMDMAGTWGAILGMFGIAITLVVYKIFNKKYRGIYGATMAVILIILSSSMFVAFINTLSYMVYYLLTLCIGMVFGVVMVMTQKQSLLRNARRHNL
ncbi:rhomboid family intramembrane serine protease [Psychrobacter sp. SZ93C1]|uniref:rhomboid family intramembrane serine protease n=1 Tax=Psychrobacter sp. SZ93C1 TaxID=2792058 RepID=UPI0018CFD1CB|nr:rhomboid family intramembrane serine protease [Psychrobacter sp. SZ93C1]MBH0066136.1 rhomboid family intramembrane serine protease [Psychrobacter sp. SZ93C1]